MNLEEHQTSVYESLRDLAHHLSSTFAHEESPSDRVLHAMVKVASPFDH